MKHEKWKNIFKNEKNQKIKKSFRGKYKDSKMKDSKNQKINN